MLRLPVLLLVTAVAAGATPLERLPHRQGHEAWQTTYFRLELQASLPQPDLERLARVADETAAALENHPLPLFAPPRERPLIRVAGNTTAYEAAGGVKGTAGFYQGRGEPKVILDGFHLRRASHELPSRLPPRMNDDLIVHEIVHLCMHQINGHLPQWLQEGIAEYIASAHRGDGRFSFRGMDEAVREHLRARIQPVEGAIPLIPVDALTALDHRGWLAFLDGLPPEDRYRAYATSLLLAHFHLHGGPERLEAVREVLLTPRREKPRVLLRPGSGTEVEESLKRYWKNRGLHLAFPAIPSAGR